MTGLAALPITVHPHETPPAPGLGPVGPYYASLVGADGRIYVTSQRGVVTVVRAGDTFEVLARNDLAEVTQATPVPVGDTLFVRTAGHLGAYRQR